MTSYRRDDGPTGAHLVVAVKSLAVAKSRLAPAFSAPQRTALVLAMMQDTLTAAAAARAVTAWSVVTPDEQVADAARSLGARVLAEPEATLGSEPDSTTGSSDDRLNAALSSAALSIRDSGAAAVIALQADLPALRTTELDDAFASSDALGRSVVLDHTGRGTAALILRGGSDDLAPFFGVDSARRHIDSGATPLGGSWPGLRLDVDTVEDVVAASRLGVGPFTRAVLDSFDRQTG